MADRAGALRAVARQVATERSIEVARRPDAARIPLPAEHVMGTAQTHQIILTTSSLDADRFGGALQTAVARHEALRLQAVRDSGRWFLAMVDEPVVRVDDVDELIEVDPAHPLRWTIETSPGQVVVSLAVSAYLMDRSAWGELLATVAAAYGGAALPPDPELGYGDYCYWLAQQPAPDSAGVRDVVQDIGNPATEPYWVFADGERWEVAGRPAERHEEPRGNAVDRVAAEFAAALRSCGWQSAGVRTRRWQSRTAQPPEVGQTDEPVVGVVRPGTEPSVSARAIAVAEALDVSFTQALVQVDVDVVDLPRLHLDDDVLVEPVLHPAPGWQCLLVRGPDSAQLYLAGAAATLPALHDAIGRSDETAADDPGAADTSGDDIPGARTSTAPGPVQPPRIVTARRTLAADVVTAAIDRRTEELTAAGLRPGGALVIEAVAGPETVANMLAGFRCRADVLLIDLDDPEAWRDTLVAQLSGPVIVSADNAVHPADPTDAATAGDGEGALLLGLSSAPGPAVLARVPLDDLSAGAVALAEFWQLSASRSCVVDAARGGEDFVVTLLACGATGADLVLVGSDASESVDLLTQVTDPWLDESLVRDWSVPLHRLDRAHWWRRAVRAEPAADDSRGAAGRWWVAEAPAAQWIVTDAGLTGVRTGGARVVDGAGEAQPPGTVGELAVAVAPGCRYPKDPRRTAECMRPAADGGRELRTAAIAGRPGRGIRLVRLAPDRAVDRNRACLTDALTAVLPDGVVGLPPSAEAHAAGTGEESAFVVATQPLPEAQLPRPLAAAMVVVDPSAADLDAEQAWRLARQQPVRGDSDEDEDWASADEQRLATEIVEPVLELRVRRNDNLFSLGATSVQLMRVLLQVKEQRGVEVALARFFGNPTVAVLAQLIDQPSGSADAALDVLDEIEGTREGEA